MRALSSNQAARASEAFGLLRSGAADAALQIARQLVAIAPDAPDAQQLLAMALAQTGDLPAAENAFELALQLAPTQPAILSNLARLLRRTGRTAQAVECLQQATTSAPRSATAWLELGLATLELGRTNTAVAALQTAVDLQPGSVRAWHALGSARRAAGELAAAESAFRAALAIDAGATAVWINLGAVLRLLGRPEQALECYATARGLGSDGPELLDAMVGALLDASRLDEAFALARELTSTHPQFVDGQVTLVNLRWEYAPAGSGDADPLAGIRDAAARHPDHDDLQLALIRLLLETGGSDEALQRLQRLRDQHDHPRLLALHANALELLDRSDAAAPLYVQAYQEPGGKLPAFLNAYVRHLLKTGQWDLAAQRAQEALEIEPDNQESWAYLATAWRLLGDPREHWLCDYEQLVVMLPVGVPEGYADMGAFLRELVSSLEVLHQARNAPLRQSLRAGTQTPGRLFGRSEPRILAAQTVLLQTVGQWLQQLPTDPTHPFLRRTARSVMFSGSWSVKLRSSGRHINHYHSDGWMSSAFYVALPASMQSPAAPDPHAGHIQFGQPPQELGLNLPPRRVIRPLPGHLALFPSYMWHGTVPFIDDQPRITIAFDMLPKA